MITVLFDSIGQHKNSKSLSVTDEHLEVSTREVFGVPGPKLDTTAITVASTKGNHTVLDVTFKEYAEALAKANAQCGTSINVDLRPIQRAKAQAELAPRR